MRRRCLSVEHAASVERDGGCGRKAISTEWSTSCDRRGLLRIFRKINMMGGNKQDWHLPRDENVKMEVMNFLENISDLLHHFSFDTAAGQKMWDLIEHSPTLAKARARCKTLDQARAQQSPKGRRPPPGEAVQKQER
eukprot:3932619-Amphidinium_carterae.1